ncbi:MAG: OsmC family protein [Candidatus Eisenbacteria bacterium]|jgi:ribosomal protein S12 methylthiotransferase accessory factor|nr:OsmC family protein [Candidatus Eisenbacteria bacterium]
MDMEITFPGRARVNAEFDGFVVQTDQIVAAGGEESAPTPFNLFLASLGACAGIYALSFLQHRGIPTEDLRMRLSTEADKTRGMLTKITFSIEVPASFPAKYVPALVRSVEQCTVKRHLHEPPAFETVVRIADAEAHVSRS